MENFIVFLNQKRTMKRYSNTTPGAIIAVDVSRNPQSLRACIQLRSSADAKNVDAFLREHGYLSVSDTTVAGKPMIVATGPGDENAFIRTLSAFDGRFEPHVEKKPFDAWKVRSYLGFAGQILQLTSSFIKGKLDQPLMLFAAANLTANGINLAYKAQKRDDTHQLQFLKKMVNSRLSPMMDEEQKPISIYENRALLREQNRPKPIHGFDNFMRKNSVNVGELGLRYFGAFSLASPAQDWIPAFKQGRLPRLATDRPLRMGAGLASIAGKTVATTSLIPDPYNPDKPGWLSRMREKYSFLSGGLIEAGAFSALAWDAWSNSKPNIVNGVNTNTHSIKVGGKYMRDWVGSLGSALFVTGYIVRSWAKFGERHVNMPELYAHVSDSLALLPHEKIPQALADTASYLANHFKNKPGFTFSEIYDKVSDDLAAEHHIAVTPSARERMKLLAQPTGKELAPVSAEALPSPQVSAIDHTTHMRMEPAQSAAAER